MSLGGLVAYGNSDDSDEETSENEEITTPREKKQLENGGSVSSSSSSNAEPSTVEAQISSSNSGFTGTVDDIEDDEPIITSPPMSQVLKLPPPKHGTGGQPDFFGADSLPSRVTSENPQTVPTQNILDESDDIKQTSTSLLSGLPMPKAVESKSVPFEVEDDEIEDEIKQKTLQMKTKAEPPPKPPKRQPVKITIPELPQYDSDEDDGPSKKKKKVEKGKTGLFALLPSPKNFSVKTTNRPLLPYTLSKKPPAPKPKPAPPSASKTPPAKPQPLVTGVPDADSDDDDDDDEEPSSFFSLNQPSAPILNVAPAVEEPEAKVEPALQGPWQGQSDSAATQYGYTEADSVPGAAAGDVAGPALPPSEGYVDAGAEYTAPYSNADYNYAAYTDEAQQEETEVQQYLQDEEFLKLAGRRKRGRETIDLIDVKADHQTSVEELTKNLTEEVPGHSYSKKRNKDLPSSQQRRKHQITYLAYQAKERELELKNQWAQNRSTKAQTQAKYGF